MPTLNVTVPHNLDRDEAMVRVRGWFDRLAGKHAGAVKGLSVTWLEYSAEFTGSVRIGSASGTLTVRSSDVNVQMKLPFLAGTFSTQIEAFLVTSLTNELKG